MKAVHSEFTPSEISKELGRRWGEVDAATKQKYESMAQNDKARYERVIYWLNLLSYIVLQKISWICWRKWARTRRNLELAAPKKLKMMMTMRKKTIDKEFWIWSEFLNKYSCIFAIGRFYFLIFNFKITHHTLRKLFSSWISFGIVFGHQTINSLQNPMFHLESLKPARTRSKQNWFNLWKK